MLEDDAEIQVIGEAGDGQEAVDIALRERPDVVVIDFALPSMNGATAARKIAASAPEVAILILSMHSEAAYVHNCLEAGARGYLLKNAMDLELVEAVKTLQVAYRETIRSNADGEGRFVRQSGGRGQYGHVKIRVEPLERGSGFEFVNGIVGGSVPKEYIGPAEAGMKEALEGGILAGYPMSDLRVTIYDGSFHEVDSSEMAFKIAGSMAIKEVAGKAKPVLLEPVMKVEVVVPDDYMGAVNGDLISRRGRLEGTEVLGGTHIVKAMVPLSEMFGYATDLRSRTQGRASFTMHFGQYEEAPRSVAEEIIGKVRGKVAS